MSVKMIHLANFLTTGRKCERSYFIDQVRTGRVTTLETFWKKRELVKLLDENPDIKIFLDSGAHSLLNAQVGLINTGTTVETEKKDCIEFSGAEYADRLTVNQQIAYASKKSGAIQFFADWSFNKNPDVRKYLDEYIEFIHKYKDQLTGYVNLDIIYNAEESWENQRYMEENGLRPIPVYHYGEDFKWLKKYVNEYEYIGIGGVAGGLTLQQFITSIGNRAFEYIAKANPHIKIHGFAVTSYNLIKQYSWTSVDSTTWLKHPAYGNVMLPRYNVRKGGFDYGSTPFVVSVSDVSLIKSSKNPHYTIAFPPEVIERIEEYFQLAGVDLMKLQTSLFERQKVNIFYYENLLKDPSVSQFTKYRGDRSFF